MKDKLCFLVCDFFREEIESLLSTGDFEDCTAAYYPPQCTRARFDFGAIRKLTAEPEEKTAGHYLLGGSCIPAREALPDDLNHIRRPRVDNCFEMIAPPRMIDALVEQGAYVTSPGWLKQWKRILEEWEFSRDAARDFFRESTKKIVLLDTELDKESAQRLEEFSLYLGLPGEIVPVGMDYFQLFFSRILSEWRLEKEKNRSRETVLQAQKEVSDYAMAFDLINILANVTSEREVVEWIFDLFSMLFAPGKLAFLPLANHVPGPVYTRPHQEVGEKTISRMLKQTVELSSVNDENDFSIRITFQDETMGVLEISDVAFPQYRKRYLHVTLTIGKVCGLALATARAFERIRRTEKLLATEKERLAVTLFSIGDGVVATNTRGEILLLNRMAEKLTGWKEADTIGRPMEDVFKIVRADTREPNMNPVETVLNTHCTYIPREPAILVNSEGNKLSIDYSCSPIFSQDSALLGTVMVFRDISERKKAEEERIRMEKLQGVIEMAGAAAHELNQPLQVIAGYSELLSLDKESLTKYIQKITSEVKRMAMIIKSLTQITRYETMDYTTDMKIIDIRKASSQDDVS